MPKIPDTLKPKISHTLVHADCICGMELMKEGSVELVIGSPPYPEKGERYGETPPIDTMAWVNWMMAVTKAAVRVANNTVVWVVNSAFQNGQYLPGCEALLVGCHQMGIICERPVIWHKNSAPGRKDWFGNDWNYCLVFRPENSTRYFDWESVAEAPKFSQGGKFHQRDSNGHRRVGSEYPKPNLARPRDVLRATVGGGHLGSKLAHENEAPFPEKLVEPFIKTLTKPGDTVLDPFCGSSTTLAVAYRLGRNSIGIDNRESQIALSRRRMTEVKAKMGN